MEQREHDEIVKRKENSICLHRTCLIDFWMQETVKKLTALSKSGETAAVPPPNTNDVEIESYLFDFLFAAQDFSTSSLL